MLKIGASAAAIFGGIKLGKALFTDPIKSAGEFQQTLNVLQATSNATDARMKQISATAMKLGADIKLPAVSASDAAQAMLELSKGGFSAKESMEGARGVLLLSTAAQIDGAQAARLVADGLHAFGMEAKDAGVLVDDFAGAANTSTASMDEVAMSLQQSGQAFHALGVPVGDAATAIAAMANAGIKGSDAGTSLKTMLQRLNPVTKQAKQAFKDMNIDVFDQQGKFVGLEKTIAQFAPKLKGMTQEQRAHALQVIFGSDASRAANVIMGMSAKQFDALRDKVTKAGSAQKLADAQTKGFNGAMSGLRSTLETLQLQIGLKLLPVLTTFIRFLAAELPTAVAVASTVIGSISDAVGMVADAIRPHMDEIRAAFDGARDTAVALFDAITEHVGSVREIGIAVAAGAAAFVILTTAVKIYTAAQIVLNAVMMANPIGLVIIAIAALVAGLVLLYQQSETAAKIMDTAWAVIRSGAQAALDFISKTVIPGVIAAWNRFGPEVVTVLTAAATAIRTVVEGIASTIEDVVDAIEENWRGVWETFGPVVKGALESARRTVEMIVDIISGVIKVFAAALRGDWGAAWGALKGLASDALGGVKDVVVTLLSSLGATALNLAGAIGSKIAAGIKTAASKLAGLAGDLAGKISSAAGQVAGSAFSYMRQIGFAIADGILSGIGNLKDRLIAALGNALSSAKNYITGKFGISSPSKVFADDIGMPIADGIVLGAMRGLDKMAGQMGAKLKVIAGQIATMTKANAPEIATAFGDWAKAGKERFDAEAAKIQTSLEAQFTKAKATIEKWKAKLTPAELQIQVAAAIAAANQVQAAVDAANMAIRALPAAQAQAWSQLLAQQAANIASLQATLMSAKGDAAIAGHDFAQGLAEADPSAQWAIQAQKHFDTAKALFEAGALSEAEFVAAHDVLQAAVAAIDDNANAKKLLDQYNTWQAALVQEAAAGAAITTQQAADQTAQADLRATFNQQQLDAQGVHATAVAGLADFNLKAVAELERKDRDTRAALLNTALTKRYERTKTHLDNITKATNTAFDDLAEIATKSGGTIAENLAKAMRDAIPLVGRAAASLAAEVRKYLKTSSPAEAGPMADLDKWWSGLAPTLIASLDSSRIKAALSDAVTPDGRGFGPGVAPMMQNQERSLTLNDGTLIRSMAELIEEFRKARRDGGSPAFTVVATGGVDAAVYASKR